MKKKVFALLLSAALVVSLSACGKQTQKTDTTHKTTQTDIASPGTATDTRSSSSKSGAQRYVREPETWEEMRRNGRVYDTNGNLLDEEQSAR